MEKSQTQQLNDCNSDLLVQTTCSINFRSRPMVFVPRMFVFKVGAEFGAKSPDGDKYSCKSAHDLSPSDRVVRAHNGPKRRRRITAGRPVVYHDRLAGVHRTLIALLLPITDGTEAAVATSALRELNSSS